jgi:hypothetical protein
VRDCVMKTHVDDLNLKEEVKCDHGQKNKWLL